MITTMHERANRHRVELTDVEKGPIGDSGEAER